MTTRRIDEIVVGERHRRDLGDIASLAANVAELGLLHPIVIRPDGTLIAGERRLAAARQLGSCEIPVNVMDLDAMFSWLINGLMLKVTISLESHEDEQTCHFNRGSQATLVEGDLARVTASN